MNNFTLLIAAAMLSTAVVWPQAIKASVSKVAEIFVDQHKNEMSKREAFKKLITDDDATVYKCYQVELNDKGSIVKKKIK